METKQIYLIILSISTGLFGILLGNPFSFFYLVYTFNSASPELYFLVFWFPLILSIIAVIVSYITLKKMVPENKREKLLKLGGMLGIFGIILYFLSWYFISTLI